MQQEVKKKPKPTSNKKRKEETESQKIEALDKVIKSKLQMLQKLRGEIPCYPLLLDDVNIGPALVDDVYDELRKDFKGCEVIDVIVDSGGGDIDAAYNLAQLFRKYGSKKLNYIVPRWAKSAATLLVCSGDSILMTPVAELGPVDPQITAVNPFEKRVEQFSPLHIDSTLELIRDEFENGNANLAKGLMERLQWPLTLGSFKKSLDIGKQYLTNLLSSRMLKDEQEKATEISTKLTTGYADHGFCINVDEAKEIGLNAQEISGGELDTVWEIHRLNVKKRKIQEKLKQKEVIKRLKEIPPAILEKLPQEIREKLGITTK